MLQTERDCDWSVGMVASFMKGNWRDVGGIGPPDVKANIHLNRGGKRVHRRGTW